MSKTNTAKAVQAMPTPEEWKALQDALASKQAEIDKIKAEQESGILLKLTQYGALQLTGLRQGYVGFYRDEWEKILNMAERVREFMESHPPKVEKGEDGLKVLGVLDKSESYQHIPADDRKKK